MTERAKPGMSPSEAVLLECTSAPDFKPSAEECIRAATFFLLAAEGQFFECLDRPLRSAVLFEDGREFSLLQKKCMQLLGERLRLWMRTGEAKR